MGLSIEECRKLFFWAFVYHSVTMLILLVGIISSLVALLSSSSTMCQFDQGINSFTKVFPCWLLALQMMAAQEDPSKRIRERSEDFPIDVFSKSILPAIGVWLNTSFATWCFLLSWKIQTEMTMNSPSCSIGLLPNIILWIAGIAAGLLLLVQYLVYLPSAFSVVYTKVVSFYRAKRRLKSLEYLSELYMNVRNYDYKLEEVLKREWFIWELEPLTPQEQAILQDVFRVEQDEQNWSSVCPICTQRIEIGALVIRHPGCGHPLHENCLDQSGRCGQCGKNTRRGMIGELRGTQTQSSIMQ